MSRIFKPPISTSNLYAPDLDRVLMIMDDGMDADGQFIPGKLVEALESRLCDYHQSEHCVAFSTGFWALVAAVRIQAIADRRDVIIPSMTYRRLADVVYWTGKRPVIVDINPDTLAVAPAAVAASVTDQTAAILGVHPIINCCDVAELMSIARRHDIPLIVDAVESVHETTNGQRVGSFGIGEVFSFHASKLINGLEGGYVCTNDADFSLALKRFRSADLNDVRPPEPLGVNATLCDGHAAFALAGLEEIEKNVSHNRQVYAAYCRELENVPHLRLVRFHESEQTSFKNIVAEVLPSAPLDRDELVAVMNRAGVLARPHYYPALHAKTYAYPIAIANVEHSELAMCRFINLPCGHRVDVDDVAATCQLLSEALCHPEQATH